MHVKDKVYVVTGAASGIGEAVARAYAQAGARGVVVADLKSSRDKLASVAGEIGGLAVTTDVAQESEIQSLIAAAETRFGPVDVFFSNAGLSRKGQQSAEHGIGGGPAGFAELDAVWGDEACRGGAGRTSRHSIWRSRHPRFGAVPAVGADGNDDSRPERRAGRWRDGCRRGGADRDRGDGGRTLFDSVPPAGA